MSFVRPDARAALLRWAEALAGVALTALGLWWALTAFGLLIWVGWAIAVMGLVLAFTGIQHARFRGNRGGPGVVLVDEGQITYLGPLTGGTVSLPEVTSLSLHPGQRPAHWVLSQPGQPDLQIPVSAEGADALLDAFASLPGIRTELMLSHLKRRGSEAIIIWKK